MILIKRPSAIPLLRKTMKLSSNKSFESKKIIMINPKEFALDYINYKLRNLTSHSIETDAIRSYKTFSNFYHTKKLKKYSSHYFPKHSYFKSSRALITSDSMKIFNTNYIDKDKMNFDKGKPYSYNQCSLFSIQCYVFTEKQYN